MTRTVIEEKVKYILSEEFHVEQESITPGSFICDTLGLDNQTYVDFVAVVKFAFNLKCPIAEVPEIKTFSELYDYIECHQ